MSNYYLLKKGEFTYNKSYSTDYPLGAIKRLNRYEMGAISTLYICFKINGDIESDFLVHYFESPKWHRGVYEIAGEGARNHGLLNIAVGDFFETQHFRPKSIREQEKIAHFLTLIQHRIEVQSGLINKLESLISGIGQRVFLHFNSFEKLGNVAKITNGNSDVQDAIEIYESGLYPFYDRSDVIKYLNTYYLDKEAIIYAGEGSEFFPRYHNGKFALHQRCYAIFDFKEEYLPKFIYYYMFTLNGYFVRNSVGSTVPSLRMGTFEKVNIPKVPVKQQLYIIKVFDCLHKKLHQAKQTKRLFEMQKQYLLQQMFI